MRNILRLSCFLLLSSTVFAACHTVSIAGAGAKTGADWNNSYAGLPTTLVRGDIYYLADGVGYANYTFSESGTVPTEVRKAQSYDNCTSTGWNTSTMGSAQAVFNGAPHQFQIVSPGFILNGNGQQTSAGCGGTIGSDPSQNPGTITDCGIKIDNTGCTSAGSGACTDLISDDAALSGGFTLKYLEIHGVGNATSEDYMIRADNSTGTTIEHMYLHYFGGVCVVVGGTSNFTFNDNYLYRNQIITGGSDPTHGQCLQSGGDSGNMVVGGNVFRDLGGTAIIMSWVGSGAVEAGPYTFYDNMIFTTPGFTPLFPSANGLLACINGFTCNNVIMSQNTIVGMGSAQVAIDSETGGTYTVQNNLWYEDTNVSNLNPHGTFTQDHNSYLVSGTSCPTGTANVCDNASANPFVGWTTGNFNLASDGADWNNRTSLSAPLNTDCNGVTFTTDRGACQYVSSTNYTLTQAIVGTGSVSSSPAGISCPGTCSASYASGTNVILTETPGSGYAFTSWSGGGCSGSSSTCTVSMTSAQSVTATFTINRTLTVTVAGAGTVNSSPSGISCPPTCSATYSNGTVVTLTETSLIGSYFGIWAGVCASSTTSNTCPVTMSATESATAAFLLTYTPYTGVTEVQPPTTPNVGVLTKNGSAVFDTSYPSGTASAIMRCTDTAISPTNPNNSFSAGLQGSGDAMQMFNSADTLFHINTTGGVGYIVPFNPTTLVCGDSVSGHVITADKNLSSPGSSSTSFNFGENGSFDWINNVWYGIVSTTQLEVYTFNSSNQFTVGVGGSTGVTGPLLSDFINALPYGSLVSAWTVATPYTEGQYVTYTMTSTDSLRPFDWTASYSSYILGDIIQPTVGNPNNCAFKLTTAGTTGSSHPTWPSANCNINGAITDGTAKWFSLGGPPVFTFQLTSASGTSGSSKPAFVPTATGHPDLMTTVSDNGLTWTDTGPSIAPEYESFAGVSQDGTRFCEAPSTNSYGFNNNYTSYNGDQGSGIFGACYSTSTNTYYLLNTGTGIMSETICSGGTGYSCTGGALSMSYIGTSIPLSGNCNFFVHNMKGSYTMDYPAIARQALIGSGSGCQEGSEYTWEPFLAFNATTTVQEYYEKMNHWTVGNTHALAMNNTSDVFGFASGEDAIIYDATSPGTLANILVSWQPTCTTTWTPNNALPPCNYPSIYDSHLSVAANPAGTDVSPACGTIYNVATLAPPPLAPWQGEEVCVPSYPRWSSGGTPSGQNAPFRFTHNFNSGGSSFFDVQFTISQLSNSGKFLAFSTDWNCTLGNTSGGTTSLCGPPWVPSETYTAGQFVNPFSSTGGSGTNYGVYEITTGGTSASSAPAWFVCNSGTAGNTVTDSNGVVYTCQGSSNGRGDVFVVALTPTVTPTPNAAPSAKSFAWNSGPTHP